jgi:hypothetical protein
MIANYNYGPGVDKLDAFSTKINKCTKDVSSQSSRSTREGRKDFLFPEGGFAPSETPISYKKVISIIIKKRGSLRGAKPPSGNKKSLRALRVLRVLCDETVLRALNSLRALARDDNLNMLRRHKVFERP